MVRRTLGREAVESSGQSGYEPPVAERRGQEVPPLDDHSFFSRDVVISNLQSALDEYFEQSTDPGERIVGAEPSDARRGVVEDVAVTELSLAGGGIRERSDGRRIFDRFSVTDIEWLSSTLAMGIRLFRKRHAFNELPPPPIPIDDRARIVIVGDWGTGLPRAQKVALEMRKILDEGRHTRQQHVLHLGDVYYSGWQREYEKRFLSYWPVYREEADEIGCYSLNGNHDMYSGGHAYYDYLLSDQRFKRQRGCSYFSFFNNNWKILNLDTSWDDAGLKDPQSKWVDEQLSGYQGNTMFMSHHQLFSAFEKTSDVLLRKLDKSLADGITSWFWGHEHRCVLYSKYDHVGWGRCVGHGGVPVYMTHSKDDAYPLPATYEYREYLDKGLEHWALMGFAVLDFEGASVHVRYIDENGAEHMNETIGAK
jgi:hypothetical protein